MADLEQLEELFEPVGRVVFKRMFGGVGIHRDGLMFALMTEDTLYFKADAETEPAFRDEGCEPFRYGRKDGRVVTLSYWQAPERVWDDPEALRDWSLRAVDAARRAAAGKPVPKRKRPV